MNSNRLPWHTMTYITTFLLGNTLVWSFGRDWLNLKSAVIVLAGLIGIAVAVLAFGAWNNHYDSHHTENYS